MGLPLYMQKTIVFVKDSISQEMLVNCMDSTHFLVSPLKVGGTSTIHANKIVIVKDIIFHKMLVN